MTRTIRRTALVTAAFLAVSLVHPPAQAAPTWRPEQTLSDPTLHAYGPDVAADAHGNVTAVWVQKDGATFVIRAATRPLGGPWSASVPLSDATNHADEAQVAVDPAGHATAVWTRLDGTHWIVQGSTRAPGGGWTSPVDLSVAGRDTSQPQVAASSSGGATAVWARYDGTSNVIQSSHLSSGGAWSEPATLSVTGQDGTDPQVAVDPNDRAVATWVRYNGTKFVIQGSVRAGATADWVPTEDLSEDSQSAFNPQVALDAAGNATAVWHRSTGTAGIVVQASQLSPGGSWSAGVDLSAETVDANSPMLAVDPSGNATATWHTYDGSEYIVESASRPANGPWSGKTEISNTGDSMFAEVTVDAAGTATALWVRSAGGGNTALVAARRPLGGAWTTPIDVSVDDFAAGEQDVTVDGAGEVTALWEIKVGASTYNIQAAGLDVAGPVVTSFGVPAAGVAGKSVALAVAATDNWSGVASYAWTFGDGTAASGPSVAHTYAKPGTYSVTLTLTDGVGNTTTRTATTTVASPPPVVAAITAFKLTKAKIARDEKTKLKVGLSTAATLKLVLKSKHRHLVKGKKKYLKVVIRKALPAGLSKITIKGKKLKPDTWKIVGTAKNTAGVSPKKKVRLTVVRSRG